MAAIRAALERLAANTFDRREQGVTLEGLRGDELATIEAELTGGARHLREVLVSVLEAQGKPPQAGLAYQEGTSLQVVGPDSAQGVRGGVTVGAAQDHQEARQVTPGPEPVPTQEAPQSALVAPGTTVRQADLEMPCALEFGEEVRVSVVGSWLWVFGVPGPDGRSSLSWALHQAGARWASSRQAWYAPGEERARRVAAVIEEHGRCVLAEVGREAPRQEAFA
jgi:hypothetical protein